MALLTESPDRRVHPLAIGSGRDRASTFLLVAACTVAAGATWVATRHAPAMSPDSVIYLSAARNLSAGHGYTDFTGQWLTNFPPGFPAALAAGHWLGLSFTTSARLINAAAFAAIVALAWVLIRRHSSSRTILVGGTLVVATSSALLQIGDHLWSEPTFCALVLAFLVALEEAVGAAANRRDRWLLVAGFIAATAFLVRYAGVALVVVGVAVVLISSHHVPSRWVLRRLAIFLGASVALPALWVLRNAASGSAAVLGPRVPAAPSPLSFATRFFDSFRSLFSSSVTLGLLVLIAAAMLAVVAVFTAVRDHQGEPMTTTVRAPAAIFIIVYATFVILSGKLAGASVDARIDSPIYVPVIVVVAGLFDLALLRIGRLRWPGWRRLAAGALIGSAIAYLGLSGLAFAQRAWADGRTARGYARQFSETPLVDAVEALPNRAIVATNQPWWLYTTTGHQPIVPSAGRAASEFSLLPETTAQLDQQACVGPLYLAWFALDLQWPYPLPELKKNLRLDVVAQAPDGVLYAVHPKAGVCPAS